MDLRLARIHYPITVLGPGRRIGIWFQGCSIRCSGCMSQDTWDATAGELMDTQVLCDLVLAARSDEHLDGVTISGGEPFQQPDALRELCSTLRRRWPEVDVLVYSGYPIGRLRRLHPDVLAVVDAVVAEPFMAGRPTDMPWRGSSNQALTVLSPQAEDRYAKPYDPTQTRLQVTVDEEGVWVTGIPRRGDLIRMSEALLGKGLVLEDVSWAT